MESVQEIPFEQVQQHPEILLNILPGKPGEEVSVSIKHHGDQISIVRQTHNPRFVETMRRVNDRVQQSDPKRTREEAFEDFFKTQDQISTHLSISHRS